MKPIFAAVLTIFAMQLSTLAQMSNPKVSPTAKVAVSTREMDRINWMEFREVVPSRVNTVLLPVGTLEPHGVINNGADNTAPFAIAQKIAQRTNAMIAPTLPYGITGSLEAYPGAFQITETAYRPFVKQILEGLAKNGFKNIIVLNGHGGGQTAVLNAVAAETAFIQAIDPTLVHPERYTGREMTTAYPPAGTYSAVPFPSSIGLYQPNQGYPKFDQKKADEYFQKVTDKVANLIVEIVRKWDLAGL